MCYSFSLYSFKIIQITAHQNNFNFWLYLMLKFLNAVEINHRLLQLKSSFRRLQ